MIDTLRLVTEAALASPWLLAVILVLAVVDALLPVVPSEALIIAAGVASVAGEQNLLAVIAVAGTGAFLGEVAGYLIGRGIGPAVRTRFTPGGARASTFDRIARLLDRRGGTVLLTARFVPAGRTVATLAAGATGYPVSRFLAFTAAGSLLSATYQALIGFLGGAAFTHDTVTALLVSFGLAIAVTVVIEAVRRVRRPPAPAAERRGADGSGTDRRGPGRELVPAAGPQGPAPLRIRGIARRPGHRAAAGSRREVGAATRPPAGRRVLGHAVRS
ncbi:DedA family protein [Pseudonocardia sp.]|uniref:DedA family protein n=1 Tax=Pseudonocardia sp. TaxID=60912 RepID=UPI00260C1A0A|nr:DedA family protein [Pseudonocardia sp.]